MSYTPHVVAKKFNRNQFSRWPSLYTKILVLYTYVWSYTLNVPSFSRQQSSWYHSTDLTNSSIMSFWSPSDTDNGKQKDRENMLGYAVMNSQSWTAWVDEDLRIRLQKDHKLSAAESIHGVKGAEQVITQIHEVIVQDLTTEFRHGHPSADPVMCFLSVNPVPRIGEPCTRDYA